MFEEASGYRQRLVATAEGDASRFKQILAEYSKAPEVTRQRLYLETVQQVYANSPLNTQVLRQALVDANPKVITGNPQQRVKAGTVITVPDHGQVVRTALTPFAANPESSESGPAARDYSVRRPWVRFP